MLTLLTLLLFGVSKPATNFNFIEVYGKVVGKKLTVCDSKDSVRVEKLNVKFSAKGDTLIVEIKGDEGIMIGGEGGPFLFPPPPPPAPSKSTSSLSLQTYLWISKNCL